MQLNDWCTDVSPYREKKHECSRIRVYLVQKSNYFCGLNIRACPVWTAPSLQLWSYKSQARVCLKIDHTGMFTVLLLLLSPAFIVNLFLANGKLHFCIQFHMCLSAFTWQSCRVSVVPSVLHLSDKDHSYYCVSANKVFFLPFLTILCLGMKKTYTSEPTFSHESLWC